MSVFRVEKNKNYTVMSNTHFKERNMSLKAKGLLSLMLSLPDDWDYTIKGLVSICKENETAIKTTLDELKKFGYLEMVKTFPAQGNGGRISYEYIIYEEPIQEGKKQGVENLGVEFLGVEFQGLENPIQLNTNKLNTNIQNTKKENTNNINRKNKKFIPPTLEEVEAYCKERNNNVNPKTFYDYYVAGDWMDSKGNKMKNWKQKVITWERQSNSNRNNTQSSGWDYIDKEFETVMPF